MWLFYNRLMAFIFLKNKKRFQKHVRRIINVLKGRAYYLIKHAPAETLQSKTLKVRVRIWKDIYYDMEINISEVQKLD